jgi:hypothetical protein
VPRHRRREPLAKRLVLAARIELELAQDLPLFTLPTCDDRKDSYVSLPRPSLWLPGSWSSRRSMLRPSIRSTLPIRVARSDPTSAADARRRPSPAARGNVTAIAPQTSPNTARCRQHVMSSQSAAPERTSAARSPPSEGTIRPLWTAADPRGVRSPSARGGPARSLSYLTARTSTR